MSITKFEGLSQSVSVSSHFPLYLNGEPWFFTSYKSDAFSVINAYTGKIITKSTGYTVNGYCKVTVSHLYQNRIFLYGFASNDILLDLNLDTEEMSIVDLRPFIVPYSGGNLTSYKAKPYHTRISTDGNLYFSPAVYRASSPLLKYDPGTRTVTALDITGNQEANFRQRLLNMDCVVLTGDANFNGVYVPFAIDDSLNNNHATVLSELRSTFGSYEYRTRFWVHWDDRGASPTKRRVFARINDGVTDTWKFVDLNNSPLVIQTNTNQVSSQAASNAINAWGNANCTYEEFAANAGDLGVSLPSLDYNLNLAGVRQVGRYIYVGEGGYINSKAIFRMIPFKLDGTEVFAGSIDFANDETYKNGDTRQDYLCNFGGVQGFSSNNEYVRFFELNPTNPESDTGLQLGYLRPDTDTFVPYDPVADPSGYIIASVDLDDPTDINGLGVGHRSAGNQTIEHLGENWIKLPELFAAIREDIIVTRSDDGDVADVTLEYTPDYRREEFTIRVIAKDVPMIPSTIGALIEPSTNNVVLSNILYGGDTELDMSNPSVPSIVNTYTGNISMRGAIDLEDSSGDGRVFIYGYLNEAHIIDLNTSTITRFILGAGNAQGASVIDGTYLVAVGALARTQAYKATYFLARLVNHQTVVSTGWTDLPTEINPALGEAFREKYGLPDSTYSDAAVEAIISQYLVDNPSASRAAIVSEAKQSAIWQAWDVASYVHSSTRTMVFSLRFKGYAALRNINIDSDGAGDLVGENDDEATTYMKLAYVSDNDIENLTASDWDLITINTASIPIGVHPDMRIQSTDDYVLLFQNDNANSLGRIHIISKTNLDNIAKGTKVITAFDIVTTINLGDSSTSYGFGNGGTNSPTTQGNVFAWSLGNIVYFTIKIVDGSSPYPCVMKIDASTGVVTTVANSANVQDRILSVPSSSTINIGSGADYFRVLSEADGFLLEDALTVDEFA